MTKHFGILNKLTSTQQFQSAWPFIELSHTPNSTQNSSLPIQWPSDSSPPGRTSPLPPLAHMLHAAPLWELPRANRTKWLNSPVDSNSYFRRVCLFSTYNIQFGIDSFLTQTHFLKVYKSNCITILLWTLLVKILYGIQCLIEVPHIIISVMYCDWIVLTVLR